MAVPFAHVPVLLDRIVEWLRATAPGLLVDATLGPGGHAEALLRSEPGFRLLGIDRDPEAIGEARRRLQRHEDRIHLVQDNFDSLPDLLASIDAPPPSAILVDLGCSSLQLDSPRRGFSFAHDGPLDMRMGPEGPSAADIANQESEEELVRIIRSYGEERRARQVARAIVDARRQGPIESTRELAELVERVVGWSSDRHIHPATRTFQALRIAVNDELGQLERFIEPAIRSLRPGGRLAAISFHSLEDRIVKHSLRRLEGRCVCPPELPECRCEPERLVRVLTKRPERPTDDEIAANPRSRSARLRVAERVGEE
jgi:16S rRNA (cytosine1402-N4)-methyltransferase